MDAAMTTAGRCVLALSVAILAVVTGLLTTLVPPAMASPLLRPEPRVTAIGRANPQSSSAHDTVLPAVGQPRVPGSEILATGRLACTQVAARLGNVCNYDLRARLSSEHRFGSASHGAYDVMTSDRRSASAPPVTPETALVLAAEGGGADLIGGPAEFDPASLTGETPAEVEARIPSDWTSASSKSGGGEVFSDPANPGRQIRIMPGYGEGVRPDPLSAGPYAVVSQNGVVTKVPLAGNPTLP